MGNQLTSKQEALVAHRRAKLTLLRQTAPGRADRRRRDGRGSRRPHAASEPPDAWNRLRRFESRGRARSRGPRSRPHRSPRALPQERVDAILAARHAHRYRAAPFGAPHRCPSLDDRRRPAPPRSLAPRRPGSTLGVPIRYVRERPGELLHMDVKKLGRIPDGAATASGAGATGRLAPGPAMTSSTRRSTTPPGSPTPGSSPTSGGRPAPASCARPRPSSPATGCGSSD